MPFLFHAEGRQYRNPLSQIYAEIKGKKTMHRGFLEDNNLHRIRLVWHGRDANKIQSTTPDE
jgi:hypothetical protein